MSLAPAALRLAAWVWVCVPGVVLSYLHQYHAGTTADALKHMRLRVPL